jgi:hypothetical protein
LAGEPVFASYDAPAGGWGALHTVAKALREQSIIMKGSRSLLLAHHDIKSGTPAAKTSPDLLRVQTRACVTK